MLNRRDAMVSDPRAPIGAVGVRTHVVAVRIEALKRMDRAAPADVVRVVPMGLAEALVFAVVAALEVLADPMVLQAQAGEDRAALMDRVEGIRC